jgi:uncharacterized membrane protein YraQ (UPF0718 family)
MAITWALLDPIMTVARPVTAFFTAIAAGLTENLLGGSKGERTAPPDLSCPVDGCCDGIDCDPETHRRHHSLREKLAAGFRFAFTNVWGDIASWFFVGLLLAGIITVLLPEELISRYLGGGLTSMLLMLAIGIPIYICATASTPVAAALILKGVSPGAALVFLIAGPATNVTSLTVLTKVLGKRATAIYLTCIALFAWFSGSCWTRSTSGWASRPSPWPGTAAEIVPHWLQLGGATPAGAAFGETGAGQPPVPFRQRPP